MCLCHWSTSNECYLQIKKNKERSVYENCTIKSEYTHILKDLLSEENDWYFECTTKRIVFMRFYVDFLE